MINTTKLKELHRKLEAEYFFYVHGEINEKEYLERIRPIDKAIDTIEMSTLQGIPAWRESSLLLSHKQES